MLPVEPPRFQPFGPLHLAIIAGTVLIPLGLGMVALRRNSRRFVRVIASMLAAMLVILEIASLIYNCGARDFRLGNALPMQLCDWALGAVVVALLTRRQLLYEPAYFWGMAGTLQAIITPNIEVAFPDVRFIMFFADHCGIVAAVIFLTVACGLRPYWISILRAMAWSEIYFVAALAVNHVTGANYGFLSEKPRGHSLLDFLSNTRPLYLLQMQGLAVAFFMALYAPFALRDLVAKVRRKAIDSDVPPN